MSNTTKNLNQVAWKKLFDQYDIPSQVEVNGRFDITSKQINEFREARLMAKFDHQINLPKIFRDHQLAILPISRGTYVISKFQAYHTLDPRPAFPDMRKKAKLEKLPDYLQSFYVIPNETIAINCAYAANILADFLDDGDLYATVAGRRGTNAFNFNIKDSRGLIRSIDVDRTQIEIDATFEGCNSLSIIEAKLDVSDDFLVRQLYYPFRFLSNNDQIKKKIRPVFLVYSNSTFHLYEYEFSDPQLYNSLHLIKYQRYVISDMTITTADLENLIKQVVVQPDPENIPFPQANNFERIINLCELLATQNLTKENITTRFDFNVRQSEYYANAARYLGLIDKRAKDHKPFYVLSGLGRQIMELPYQQRQWELCKRILQHQIFLEIFKCWLETGNLPEENTIIEMMQQSNLSHLKNPQSNTFNRRASTIRRWLEWIIGLIEESNG